MKIYAFKLGQGLTAEGSVFLAEGGSGEKKGARQRQKVRGEKEKAFARSQEDFLHHANTHATAAELSG